MTEHPPSASRDADEQTPVAPAALVLAVDDGLAARSLVESMLRSILDAFAAVREDLRGHQESMAGTQRIIEKLHEENDRLRAGERQMLLRPIQVDLQRMRNDLVRQAETLPADLTAARTADMLVSFAVTAELILERCGVEVVRPKPGTVFNASIHRAVGTTPAPSPEDDATVAECVADGYIDAVDGRTMRPASVRVHIWDGQFVAQIPPARSVSD